MKVIPMRVELTKQEKHCLTAAYVLLDAIYNKTECDTSTQWALLSYDAANAINKLLIYLEENKNKDE